MAQHMADLDTVSEASSGWVIGDENPFMVDLTPGDHRIPPWINDTPPKNECNSECDSECPLRELVDYEPEPPLPPAVESPTLSRKEACAEIYSAIKEWQTRLLYLEPGELGTPLSACLVVVDVVHFGGVVLSDQQERVEYTALSYTWGTQEFPRSININGVECPITENLYAFLQRFRSVTVSQYIWADLLCINQFALDEKAVQVRQMLAIFEKAHTVSIWLGEEDPSTKLAVAYLKWVKVLKPYQTQHLHHTSECFGKADLVVSGIEDLCSREWVRRLVCIVIL